jgi:hypothetical protein
MRNKYKECFYVNDYYRKQIRKLGMCNDDIDRMERMVGRSINHYGLLHNELSYRIIIKKLSWEVNVFDINVLEDNGDFIECMKNMIKLKVNLNDDLCIGYREDRLYERFDDFINTTKWKKYWKIRICDVKYIRKEYDEVEFGSNVKDKFIRRLPYNFLKYNDKNNRILKSIMKDFKEWLKNNQSDNDDFKKFE